MDINESMNIDGSSDLNGRPIKNYGTAKKHINTCNELMEKISTLVSHLSQTLIELEENKNEAKDEDEDLLRIVILNNLTYNYYEQWLITINGLLDIKIKETPVSVSQIDNLPLEKYLKQVMYECSESHNLLNINSFKLYRICENNLQMPTEVLEDLKNILIISIKAYNLLLVDLYRYLNLDKQFVPLTDEEFNKEIEKTDEDDSNYSLAW